MHQLQPDHDRAGHNGGARLHPQVHRQREGDPRRYRPEEAAKFAAWHRRHATPAQFAATSGARATAQPRRRKN